MKKTVRVNSAEQRARELFKLVYGRPTTPSLEGNYVWFGFMRLAKLVLALEKKKKRRKG